jgi:hypothetical protein
VNFGDRVTSEIFRRATDFGFRECFQGLVWMIERFFRSAEAIPIALIARRGVNELFVELRCGGPILGNISLVGGFVVLRN